MRSLWKECLPLLLCLLSAAAPAETTQAFADRLRSAHTPVTVTLNMRNDKTTFGSLSIGVPPKVLADREAVAKVLQEVGRFAGEARLRVIVVARKPDVEAYAAQLKEAGATAVIQPGGSKRDAEVIEACEESETAMVFTRHRHFRH